MEAILEAVLRVVLEVIVVSGILGGFFLKRDARLKNTIETEFKKMDTYFNAQFDHKHRVLEELLGPIMIQLERSSITLNSYDENNYYREVILKQCNETIRDLILTKGHLIPPDLQTEAIEFLKHYDSWLEQYHKVRVVDKNMEKPFVFTHNFPHDAKARFIEKYKSY